MARWVAPIFVAVAFVGLVTIGIWQVRKHLPRPEEWARLLELELSKTLAVPVKVGSADIGLTGAAIKNLQIQPDPRSPTGYILTVPQIQLRWSLGQILLTNATLFLWRDRTGRWNIQPFIAQKPERPAARIPILRIRESTLILGDETLPLPNGLPFRLKLVNVEATVQPVELGTRIEASGQILPPLGTSDSQANLTIVQIGDETGRETHGRFVGTNISFNALPKQLQTFGNGQVSVTDGTIAEFLLNWHQTDGETNLSGSAKFKDAVFKLRGMKTATLIPLQASLSFSLLLTQKQVRKLASN